MSSTLFCWRFRLNTPFFLLLYRSTLVHKHKIFCLNIQWPPYQLYEHACDYYHLKWCNRDDNCWTNKYTHTLKHYQTGSVVKKTKFNKYITHRCVCIYIYIYTSIFIYIYTHIYMCAYIYFLTKLSDLRNKENLNR